MNKGRAISEFLVALARHVERLTDEELEWLLKDAGLGGILRKQPTSRRTERVEQAEVQSQAEALMRELANQTSRERAAGFLANLAPSRRVLIEAAKMRDVHIIRQDTVSTISEK